MSGDANLSTALSLPHSTRETAPSLAPQAIVENVDREPDTSSDLSSDGLSTGQTPSCGEPTSYGGNAALWKHPLRDPKFQAGLELLLRAHTYAEYTSQDALQYAVEIASLRDVGLCTTDLRWLSTRRYVQHGEETTTPNDPIRTFRRGVNLAFSDKTCFTLTRSGVTAAKYLAARSGNIPAASAVPHWDPALRELRFQGKLIKRCKRPSPNQELILAAFQEEGWPPRIDDPLPPATDQDPRQRLRDAIWKLNRSQRHSLIRFHGDGTGQGVRWMAVPSVPG